jgi:hypothetical protein
VGFDPWISEWDNPLGFMLQYPTGEYIAGGSQPGGVKHLSTPRNRKQPRFP